LSANGDQPGVRLAKPKAKSKSKWAKAMYYRIGIFLLLVLLVLALLWPSKRRTALVFVGLIAVLAAIVVLVVELINGWRTGVRLMKRNRNAKWNA
jgi:di/tricarboxylate transporter